MRGKRLTDKEFAEMLAIEFEKAYENALKSCNDMFPKMLPHEFNPAKILFVTQRAKEIMEE